MINKLTAKIQKTKAPIVVGLDPMLNYIPKHIQEKMCIRDSFRGQGFAYEACKAILKVAYERGAVYLYCRIKEGNTPSLNLAKKLGFEKIDYHLQEDSDDMEVWRYACRELENQIQ